MRHGKGCRDRRCSRALSRLGESQCVLPHSTLVSSYWPLIRSYLVAEGALGRRLRSVGLSSVYVLCLLAPPTASANIQYTASLGGDCASPSMTSPTPFSCAASGLPGPGRGIFFAVASLGLEESCARAQHI